MLEHHIQIIHLISLDHFHFLQYDDKGFLYYLFWKGTHCIQGKKHKVARYEGEVLICTYWNFLKRTFSLYEYMEFTWWISFGYFICVMLSVSKVLNFLHSGHLYTRFLKNTEEMFYRFYMYIIVHNRIKSNQALC